MRGHILYTLLLFTLDTAYQLRCEHADTGIESVCRQRWQRELLAQSRNLVVIFAQGYYGISHMTEHSLLGVNIKDRSPGVDTHLQILAKYGLAAYR